MSAHLTTIAPPPVIIALLIVRLASSIVFIGHGYQKLFTNGLSGITEAFAGMGAPLPELTAP